MSRRPKRFLSPLRALALLSVLSAAACTPGTPDENGIFDPYEERNRRVHETNRNLDSRLFGGEADTSSDPTESSRAGDLALQGINNFTRNLILPGSILNNLLQLDPDGTMRNTSRFLINSTLGVGGIFDPASSIGVLEKEADFGLTMARWGVPEGAYIEMPVFGPTTERDLAGSVVDLFLHPACIAGGFPSCGWIWAARAAEAGADRIQYSEIVNDLLYESEDSYAQTRLLYLQTRRFDAQTEADDEFFDPYDDPYADPYEDPYDDPYADPYE